MKYLLVIFCGLLLLSCTVLDKERIDCINETYETIPMNEDTRFLNEIFETFLYEYLDYDSDIKYYIDDSLIAKTRQLKLNKNEVYYNDIIDLFPKIDEALTDYYNNSLKTSSAISFCNIDNIKKYNNIIPTGCNEYFTVRDGWEIKITRPGFSKDSTVSCIISFLNCGVMCFYNDLLILQKVRNKWTIIKTINLKPFD